MSLHDRPLKEDLEERQRAEKNNVKILVLKKVVAAIDIYFMHYFLTP